MIRWTAFFASICLLAAPAFAEPEEEPAPAETPAPTNAEPAPEGPLGPPDAVAAPEAPPEDEPAPDLQRGTATLYADAYERFAGGDFAGALPLFEEVLRREPEHPSARNYVVECLTAVGRDDDAAAAREGAGPPGEATTYAPAPPKSGNDAPAAPQAEVAVAKPPETPEARKARLNPRGSHRGGFGITLLGPGVGLGIFAELRPHWAVAINGGIGVLVLKSASGSRSGLAGLWLEATAMPIPFRLTPTIGVGITSLAGTAVWRFDSMASPIASRGQLRLVGYWHLGLRYDSRKGFYLAAGVGFIPTGRGPGQAFAPWPGFKFGLRF